MQLTVDPATLHVTGAGFDKRYAHRLFQPFQRLRRDEDYDGAGIGLALAAKIVHRHGGAHLGGGRAGSGRHVPFHPQGADG